MLARIKKFLKRNKQLIRIKKFQKTIIKKNMEKKLFE